LKNLQITHSFSFTYKKKEAKKEVESEINIERIILILERFLSNETINKDELLKYNLNERNLIIAFVKKKFGKVVLTKQNRI